MQEIFVQKIEYRNTNTLLMVKHSLSPIRMVIETKQKLITNYYIVWKCFIFYSLIK